MDDILTHKKKAEKKAIKLRRNERKEIDPPFK